MGEANFIGNVNIDGITDINTLQVSESAEFNCSVNMYGSVIIEGNLKVNADTTLKNLNVTNETIVNTLKVNSTAVVDGEYLKVRGNLIIESGDASIDYNLTVGQTIKTKNLTVSNVLTSNNVIALATNKYTDQYNYGAMDAGNSNIYNVNQIQFGDLCENAAEGIQFYNTSTTVDSLWAKSGVLYFTPKRAWGTNGTNTVVLTSDNLKNYTLTNTGGTLTGPLILKGATSAVMDKTTKNPRIIFSSSESGAEQQVGIVYTNFDSYRASKGLKVMDVDGNDSGNVWLEVQGKVYSPEFVENGTTLSSKYAAKSHTHEYAAKNHTHNYAGSASAGGSATKVRLSSGTDNVARYIWFSDSSLSTDAVACYDTGLKYNPAAKTLYATNIVENGTALSNKYAAKSHTHEYAAKNHTHTKSQITDFPASLPANGGTSNYANYMNGTYTGNGGAQAPSYVPSGKVRFNMMNQLKGLTQLPTYADFILMDTYTGSDVPYVTAIGVLKRGSTPRAYIATGKKGNTTTWEQQVELITSGNIGTQTVATATKATGVVDYAVSNKTIQIGYGGTGISGDDIKYIAGYTKGDSNDVDAKIKDVSKDALKSWLGLDYFTTTAAYPVDSEISQNVIGYTNGLSSNPAGDSAKDGALIGQRYSDRWKAEIYLDYCTGHMATRGKNNGTWYPWQVQLDSGNYTKYAAAKDHTHEYIGNSNHRIRD